MVVGRRAFPFAQGGIKMRTVFVAGVLLAMVALLVHGCGGAAPQIELAPGEKLVSMARLAEYDAGAGEA